MKLKKLLGGLFLSFTLIACVGAGLLVKENRENTPMEKVEATTDWYTVDINSTYWTSSLRASAGANRDSNGNLKRSSNGTADQVEIVNQAVTQNTEFWGHFWYSGGSEGWPKDYTNNATGSSWSGGGSSNFKCGTDGVYNFYFKPQDSRTYITYGTITVTLHYMNASTGAQIKTTSATTTSQNNFAVPAYDSISGYDRNGAVWKTTNSATGANYTATRLTTVTKDLYVFYTPALTVTRHALFFKDDSYMGTAQLETASVLSGGTYTYDTASDWPNGYDYGNPKLTYTFEGVYATGNTSNGAHSDKVTGSTTVNANKTIYEVFTYYSSITMTFKPNGGTGSETTRQKTYGTPFTVPTPASLGIGAGAARVMLSWNENQDGSGQSYSIDGTATYTGNIAKTFWLQQDFKSYEYSVDGGSTWVQMPKTDTATDCVATYASSASNYLPAGHIITIRGYYGSGTHTEQTIDVWTGNQYESGGNHYVSFGTYNKMVLYVTNTGSFNLDVWGGSERGIAIDSSGFVTKYECQLDETTHCYTGTITVHPGDIIKAFHSYATVYTITMTGISGFGIDVNGNVTVPAVYQLTLTWDGTPGGYPTVNIDSMVAVDSATLIAQTFNDDMTPLCTAVEGGTAPSSLVTQWGKESGYYSKLTNDTKNILNGTTASSDGDVLAMRAKYDQIVGKYKGRVTGIDDYMSRNPASIQSSGLLGLSIFSNGQNQSLVIVIVITSLGILSVGAYFFFRKSKKSEE